MRGRGEPAVLVKRGRVVESVHRAVVAVADPRGKVVARLGDPGLVTYLRSGAKPFQALPLFTTGAVEEFSLAGPELAILAGSHAGEDRHTKLVEGLLSKAGVGPEALQCGAHPPMHSPSAERIGDSFTAVHHRCSGKHAGMLLLARHLGADPAGYLKPTSPGQRLIRKAMAEVAGVPLGEVRVGIDGCSAPNFAMPVRAAAVALARLGRPEGAPAAYREGLARMRDAMLAHPAMVAGEGRFDTDLMERLGGAVVGKTGAEGFYGVALPRKGLGFAVKVEDGNGRAAPPVVVASLRQLRAARPAQLEALEPHLGGTMRNWAGLEVGGLEARFRLRRA